MATELQSVVSRLSRLNKNELIDIIVYRRIPENLVDCDVLKYIKKSDGEKTQDNERINLWMLMTCFRNVAVLWLA